MNDVFSFFKTVNLLIKFATKIVAVAFSVQNIVFMKLFSFGFSWTILCILSKKDFLSSEYALQLKI